jgi:hypothetical protein
MICDSNPPTHPGLICFIVARGNKYHHMILMPCLKLGVLLKGGKLQAAGMESLPPHRRWDMVLRGYCTCKFRFLGGSARRRWNRARIVGVSSRQISIRFSRAGNSLSGHLIELLTAGAFKRALRKVSGPDATTVDDIGLWKLRR